MPLNEREQELISGLVKDVATNTADIKNLFQQVKTFVTKAEFGPIKLLTYALVASVMGSFVTSLLGRVIIK
ncbi:MAG: hypothetical protein ACRYG5_06610 [Janthinobacterium lividum]